MKSQYGPTVPFHGYMVSSACSGALAGAVSNVADVVKTRIQAASTLDAKNTGDVLRSMWRNEGGLRAFTKGMGARVLWVAPSATISFTIYESLKDILT